MDEIQNEPSIHLDEENNFSLSKTYNKEHNDQKFLEGSSHIEQNIFQHEVNENVLLKLGERENAIFNENMPDNGYKQNSESVKNSEEVILYNEVEEPTAETINYESVFGSVSNVKFSSALLHDLEIYDEIRPNEITNKNIKQTSVQSTEDKTPIYNYVNMPIDIPYFLSLDPKKIREEYSGPELENGKVTLKFMEELMEMYKNNGILHRAYAYKILLDIRAHYMEKPSLIDVEIDPEDKFTVCGDIHGQFFDLMNIFKLNGLPSETNPYLFNGDFVDRGSFSVECIFTLFGFKLLYPNHFFLARGNHESFAMNQRYGFLSEVYLKYSVQMTEAFTEVFNWLPLAHCLNKRVLVVHGGLFSEDDVTLSDIKKIERNRQPPRCGLMCEILWSDPQLQNGRGPSRRKLGCYQFGPDITKQFLELNKLDYIIRSHELKNNGYEIAHDGKCITVFSAPNYCGFMGNKGAFITLKGKDMEPKFTTYEAVPCPQKPLRIN